MSPIGWRKTRIRWTIQSLPCSKSPACRPCRSSGRATSRRTRRPRSRLAARVASGRRAAPSKQSRRCTAKAWAGWWPTWSQLSRTSFVALFQMKSKKLAGWTGIWCFTNFGAMVCSKVSADYWFIIFFCEKKTWNSIFETSSKFDLETLILVFSHLISKIWDCIL